MAVADQGWDRHDLISLRKLRIEKQVDDFQTVLPLQMGPQICFKFTKAATALGVLPAIYNFRIHLAGSLCSSSLLLFLSRH